MPPPPPGKMWVRNPDTAWALSVMDAVERYTAVGVLVPEHLERLACRIGPDTPPDAVELVDSDFGVPLPPFASAEPAGVPPAVEDEVEVAEQEAGLWAAEETTGPDLEGWTVAELKDALDQLGIDYPASARKHELIGLLSEAETGE